MCKFALPAMDMSHDFPPFISQVVCLMDILYFRIVGKAALTGKHGWWLGEMLSDKGSLPTVWSNYLY